MSQIPSGCKGDLLPAGEFWAKGEQAWDGEAARAELGTCK